MAPPRRSNGRCSDSGGSWTWIDCGRRLPLTPFFFDCLYVNGAALIDAPQLERFGTLAELAPAAVVPRLLRPDPEAAFRFVEDTLQRGHEGVMVKALKSGYASGRRGQHWLKVKLARTLDLVVLAADGATVAGPDG